MKTVTLTMQDQKTLQVLISVDEGKYTVAQGAELLGLCERQVRRKLKAFRTDGMESIPHKNRGRRPAHVISDQLRKQVADLAKGEYEHCNNHHFKELLAEREGIDISVSSVRRIRRDTGLSSPRKRRPPKHRSKRRPKPQPGMMLQIDGSPFRWLGDDGAEFSMIAAIDDATNEVFALFRKQEDTVGYMLLLRDVLKQRGVPLSLYSDRHSIFFPPARAEFSVEDQLAGKRPKTQFGRAAQELGIAQIPANSPQAKGRVERLFNTLQDRLTAEMRIEAIATIEQANEFLPRFLKRFNARFAKPPANPESAYRPAPKATELQQILCLEFTRTVAKDNTVSFGGHCLTVCKPSGASYAKKKVTIRIALDGSLSFWHQDQCIGKGPKAGGELRTDPSAIAAQLPPQASAKAREELPPPPAKPKPKQASVVTPAPDHPWRRYRDGK